MQIWKGSGTSPDPSSSEGEKRVVVEGSSMDSEKILESLETAQNDPNCTELDVRDIDFEQEECLAFINAIRSSRQRRRWKSVKLSHCGGQVNDVVLATMSQDSVESFSLDSMVNAQTFYGISMGLKYSANLLSLGLSVQLSGEYADILARALVHSKLQDLNLSGSSIEESAISPLGFAIRLNKTLKSLTLDGCNLEDTQTSHLLVAMQDHPTLRTLSLQQNACHEQGMAAIAALLHTNQLVELDLSYLTRPKKVDKPATTASKSSSEAEGHEEAKSQDTTDKDREIEENQGKDGNANNLDSSNDKNDSPEEAKQGDKKVDDGDSDDSDDDDSRQVRNTSLVTLQLAGNNLTDAYVSSLLSIFGKDSELKELNLFGNRLSDNGVVEILKRLKYLKRLKALWLSFNNITTQGARKVADAMESNYSLEDVKIQTMVAAGGDGEDEMDKFQALIDHYSRLNKCGRHVLQIDRQPDAIPLSLFPYILERCTRISGESKSHEADAILCFLQGGPMVIENPNLPTAEEESSDK